MSKVVTILRVLEYTGPVELVNAAIEQRGVKGSHHFGMGTGITIREGLIGEVPRPIQGDEVNHYLTVTIPEKDNDRENQESY